MKKISYKHFFVENTWSNYSSIYFLPLSGQDSRLKSSLIHLYLGAGYTV
jgi:hypothetical protein